MMAGDEVGDLLSAMAGSEASRDVPPTTPKPRQTRAKAPKPAAEPEDAEAVRAAAAATERALEAAAVEYSELLPKIQSAQPERGTVGVTETATGTAWAVAAWEQLLGSVDAPAIVSAKPFADGADVFVTVTCSTAADAAVLAPWLVQLAEERGNLGTYTVLPSSSPTQFSLMRRNVEDPTHGWREHPKTKGFYPQGAYRQGIWRMVGLVQVAGNKEQFPQCAFGSDARGGTCTLTLPPGMLPRQVTAAEDALRQALGMPNLEVTVDGLNPVLHLNTKALIREFPTSNPLRPTMFTRPKNQPERYAAAADFVLPLGVRQDGSPILLRQDVAPHAAVFGGTGMGKTVLLAGMIRAAAMQGCEVILADAKNGVDLRRLAYEAHDGNLPGVVFYAGGSDAELHRSVLFAYDELARRKAVAQRLAQRGVEFRPTPMLLVFDEVGAWLDALSSGSKPEKDAAAQTLSRLTYIAAQGRELRVFLLLAGQHAYVSAMPGKLRANIQTISVLGPPTSSHLANLFDSERRPEVAELGSTITKSMKGRGVVVDTESGNVELFQGFFNEPGRDAEAVSRALARTPKLRRYGIVFPTDDEPGSDGSWMEWTPATDPSSDSLLVRPLAGPDGVADPSMKRFDPVDVGYRPGSKPIPARHFAATNLD